MADRQARSTLAPPVLQSVQAGTFNYTWRGVPCIKNPFDLALYQLLIWRLRPRTIIEIGSNAGGSALYFADMLRAHGIDGNVVSLDVNKVERVQDPGITFLAGDAHNLGDALTDERLNTLPRPWLVVEDSSHQYRTCLAVMRFFDHRLQPGEYLVIEDGIVDDLGLREQFDGGPNRAIKEFLENCDGRYVIDGRLCDFYGHNVTWNTNGYLRKVRQG